MTSRLDTPAPQTLPPTGGVAYRSPERHEVLALLTAVMLPMFLGAVDQTLLATATPRIASELGGLGDSSWIAVGYLLSATIMAPVYGRLGDRYGRRPALLGALGVFALGSLVCGVAQSMSALILSRVLQGLGGGGLMVLSQALIGELVPPIDRPRYQAYFAVVFTASSVGGPVIGGLVVHHADWRWLFFANLPLCALAAWRVSRLPAAPRSAMRDAPTDLLGVLLFAATASTILLWFSLAGHRFHWLSLTSAMLLAGGVAGTALLLWQQRKHPAPFLPLDLLRLPGVGWICATVLCFGASMFAMLFLLPIYLQLGHGVNASDAGLQMLPLTVGIVAGSTINSRITMRTQLPTLMPPYGLGMSAVALMVLALAPSAMWLTNIIVALIGLGFGTVMSNAQLTVQLLAGRTKLGAAAALLAITRSSGASLGTAAFGGLAFALLKLAPGGTEDAPIQMSTLTPDQVTHAFRIAFGSIALFVALGAWISTRIPRVHLAHEAD
jgi:MFS family permease